MGHGGARAPPPLLGAPGHGGGAPTNVNCYYNIIIVIANVNNKHAINFAAAADFAGNCRILC